MNLQLIKQDKFNDILVDVYRNDNDEVFMTAKQLGEALEYSTKAQAIINIINRNEYLDNEEFSVQLKLQAADGKPYQTRLFNKKGIKEIISISERPIAIKKKVANVIDSKWVLHNHLKPRQEDEFIHLIQTTFKSFHSKREVKIDDYRCDLLFPDFKLVIECDEYGHRGYDKDLEIKRENHIKSKGYDIIRFNPNGNDFYIGETLSDILEFLMNANETNKKNNEEE